MGNFILHSWRSDGNCKEGSKVRDKRADEREKSSGGEIPKTTGWTLADEQLV